MPDINNSLVGYACAYTPLPIISSAEYTPFRILPVGSWPDQAGHLLHDNLCPHVKRILDRALSNDLPDLSGMVFVNSCDAMRRLYDAWKDAKPEIPALLLDLPVTASQLSIPYFSNEIKKMKEWLEDLSGKDISEGKIKEEVSLYNDLYSGFEDMKHLLTECKLKGSELQDLYNMVSERPVLEMIEHLKQVKKDKQESHLGGGVPIFLFGNVLPDTRVFTLLEDCGAKVSGDDFCTGSRLFTPFSDQESPDVFDLLSNSILSKPPCARTFNPEAPGGMSEDVLEKASLSGAKGVIGHTLKFCDPYLARIPSLRKTLKKKGMPLLMLEGDLTLRSIGQQRTRIEAFIEMLR